MMKRVDSKKKALKPADFFLKKNEGTGLCLVTETHRVSQYAE